MTTPADLKNLPWAMRQAVEERRKRSGIPPEGFFSPNKPTFRSVLTRIPARNTSKFSTLENNIFHYVESYLSSISKEGVEEVQRIVNLHYNTKYPVSWVPQGLKDHAEERELIDLLAKTDDIPPVPQTMEEEEQGDNGAGVAPSLLIDTASLLAPPPPQPLTHFSDVVHEGDEPDKALPVVKTTKTKRTRAKAGSSARTRGTRRDVRAKRT